MRTKSVKCKVLLKCVLISKTLQVNIGRHTVIILLFLNFHLITDDFISQTKVTKQKHDNSNSYDNFGSNDLPYYVYKVVFFMTLLHAPILYQHDCCFIFLTVFFYSKSKCLDIWTTFYIRKAHGRRLSFNYSIKVN